MNAFMDIMSHAKFHFNRLMLTLIFGIWASEPSLPLGPGERLKRPGLIGLIKYLRTSTYYGFSVVPCVDDNATVTAFKVKVSYFLKSGKTNFKLRSDFIFGIRKSKYLSIRFNVHRSAQNTAG